MMYAATLVLGLRPRQKRFQGRGLGELWESVSMKIHTPKWAPILGVGVSVDFQTFRERLQKSKHLALRIFLYHWKAIEV
jgi:hypothetical protein